MDSPYLGAIFIWAGNFAPRGYHFCDGSLLQIQQNSALFAILGTYYGGNGTSTFQLPDLRGRFPLCTNTNNAAYPISQLGQVGGHAATTLGINNLPAHSHAAAFTPATGTQQVTIPAVAGSGAITASASIAVTPGSTGVQPVNGTNNYYLTGTKAGPASTGGFTTTAPSTGNTAGATGVSVSVDSSNYQPAIPQQTVNINNVVTGGTVAIGNNGASAPFDMHPPYQALNFIIAIEGLFPPRN
jgi:microcystin-dependent protein